MPVSYGENRKAMKEWMVQKQPKTLFDIGMGYGEIGKGVQRVLPDIEINGVEIFLPYLVEKRSFASIYKRIVIADVMDCIDKLWKVDVVTAFDVIEHLRLPDGIKAIKYLRQIANIGVLISVPIVPYKQGAIHGNPAEIHRWNWSIEEMEKLGAKTIFKGTVTGLFEFGPL